LLFFEYLNIKIMEVKYVDEKRAAREVLREKEGVSTRLLAVVDYRINNPGVTIKEAREFVDSNMTGETPLRGDPIWKNPDSAGKYVGGIGAADGRQQMIFDKPVRLEQPTDASLIKSEQYSVLWSDSDEEGQGPRGGIGGGIKAWHEKDQQTGRLTEEIVGYINF
jgi:hypothetical protein